MPLRYKCKVFVNLILFILVIQLNHLVNIYEMARISFDVPTIEHLQKTQIEREVKIIYQQTVIHDVDREDHRMYSAANVCGGGFYYGGMHQ